MPVSSVKQRKAMKREQAIVHEALSSCFFLVFSKSKLKQDRSQLQGRKSQAEIGNAKFAKFASFFFLTRNAWSFWAKRLDEKNKIGKRVERQMAKLESICLENGKNGCRARPATSTTPTKTPKQPLQQLTADQISKLQLRWHPYALKEYRITVSCSDSWADMPWAKWLRKKNEIGLRSTCTIFHRILRQSVGLHCVLGSLLCSHFSSYPEVPITLCEYTAR